MDETFLVFSERIALQSMFAEWARMTHADDSPCNVFAWMQASGLIDVAKAKRRIQEHFRISDRSDVCG